MRSVTAALVLLLAPAPLWAQGRVAVYAGPGANRPMIWVLGADNKLSEYDGVEFRKWVGGLAMPPEARKHPENIFITAGQIVMYSDLVAGTTLRHIWSTNHYAHELVGGADDKRAAAGGGFLATTATPVVFASNDGQRLYWFENRCTALDRGAEIWRDGDFLSWTTDLTGNDPKPVTSLKFERCKCDTGACTESCPEIAVWAPDAGVSDFFFATRWVPGQVGSDFLDTSLSAFANGAWSARKLDHAVDHFLAAADHGNIFIEAPQDNSGDDDESDAPSNTAMLNIGGKAVTIFDEHARFHDEAYLVGIATTRAAISPDVTRVAYAIAGLPASSADIPPRVAGKKSDAAEVARLRKELSDLPRTEVIAVADPAKVVASLPNTDLIGWLDNGRLLVLKQGELQVVDAATGAAKATGIKADGPQFVFLR